MRGQRGGGSQANLGGGLMPPLVQGQNSLMAGEAKPPEADSIFAKQL